MKNTIKVLGIIALVAVIGFGFVACDNSSPASSPASTTYNSVDADGNAYKLVITEDGARAAVAGDSYRLEITFTNGSVKISVGKVSSVTASGAFELQPSASGAEPFTVTVSGTEIAAIDGTIAVEGGETVPAPTFQNSNGSGTHLGGVGESLVVSGVSGEVILSNGEVATLLSQELSFDNGTGSMKTDGSFTFTKAAPSGDELKDVGGYGYLLEDEFNPISFVNEAYTISDTNAKGFSIASLRFSDGWIVRGNQGFQATERVFYIYVDRDLTITCEGKTREMFHPADGAFMGYHTDKEFTLSLKAGWNTLYRKFTREGDNEYLELSIKNPDHLMWCMGGK